MKSLISIACAIVMTIMLCACGTQKQAAPTEASKEEYQQLIEKLEAGDYDGARAMIDALEGTTATEPAAEEITEPASGETTELTMPAAPVVVESPPKETLYTAGTAVVLDDQNAKEYFEVIVGYSYGPAASFSQSLALKEEYAQRVIDIENVRVTVSYFLSDAYGQLDEKANVFAPDHYEIRSEEAVTLEIPVSDKSMVNFIQGEYDKKNRCFPDFPVDMKITDAKGTLILTD